MMSGTTPDLLLPSQLDSRGRCIHDMQVPRILQSHMPWTQVAFSTSHPHQTSAGPSQHLFDATTGKSSLSAWCNAEMFSPEFCQQYSREEQFHMVRALTKIQIRNYKQLFRRMEGMAEARGWLARRSKIQSFSSRLDDAAARLEAAFELILQALSTAMT